MASSCWKQNTRAWKTSSSAVQIQTVKELRDALKSSRISLADFSRRSLPQSGTRVLARPSNSQINSDYSLSLCGQEILLLLLLLLLLLHLLALQPTMGVSLLSDFLPFLPFLTQFSPPSYSHRLDIFFNVFNPSFPWSSSDSPTHWLPF